MAKSVEQEWEELLLNETKKFQKLEKKLGRQKRSKFEEVKNDLMGRIPEKVIKTLDAGFYKAFQLIFSKGIGIIGKTFDEKDLTLEFVVNDFRVNGRPDSKSLRHMEKSMKKENRVNVIASTVEGIGLGALGIGLPDIPLFLGVLLKGIYKVSLGYGFDYKEEKEQILILKMITAALSDASSMKEADGDVEAWIAKVEQKTIVYDIEEEIKKASQALSKAMLLSKFIQGFFVVGAIGGLSNPVIYHKVMNYVLLKYKKRYINQKRVGIKNERQSIL